MSNSTFADSNGGTTLTQKSSPPEARSRGGSSTFSTGPIIVVTLIAIAFTALQLLIGGAKLVYSLPALTLLGVAGLSAIWLPKRSGAGRPIGVCMVATMIVAGYVVWRSWAAPVNYLARADFYTVLGALVAYGLTSIYFATPRARLWILWVLLGLALAQVAVGVVQFKESQNFMLLPWMFRPDYGYRASGFYICPNHLAGLLEMLGLMALSLTLWGRLKPWLRLLAGYCFLMALVGLAITGSRGGYLSMVGGLTALWGLSVWVVRKVRRRWFYGVLLLGLFAIAGLVGTAVWVMSKSANLEQRLSQVWDPTNMRVYMWKAALETHKLCPWLGTGSGTYLYFGRHFRDHSVQNDPQHVHSDYLELLAEYGIIGCALMACFLLAHFAAGLAAIRNVTREKLRPMRATRSNELALLLGAVAGLAALALHSVIDFNLHIPANAAVCALLFGILANPRMDDSEHVLRWRLPSSWPRYVAPVFALALIAFAAPRIRAEYYGERARVCLRDLMSPEAIRFAEAALQLDPQNPNLYYYLGEGRHNLAMLEKDSAARSKLHMEAARAFSDGLKVFPRDIQLLLSLARTLDNMHRFPEADFIYGLALDADPKFGPVYAYYGYHYYIQHRLLRAEKLYTKARELGDISVAPLGLNDVVRYRAGAGNEDTADLYPIEDEPGDESWEPGEP